MTSGKVTPSNSTTKGYFDETVGEVVELSSTQDLEKNQKDLTDGDLILTLANAQERITYTEQEEKVLVKKLDLYVTILICFVYGTQFMDKVTISFTGIMGLRNDLHLKRSRVLLVNYWVLSGLVIL
ncbi:unnamed protein product [Wickerhamomyces anomalus]